ncbi:MAG: lysyl oxidase family protein [Armatimonadota bacterium]
MEIKKKLFPTILCSLLASAALLAPASGQGQRPQYPDLIPWEGSGRNYFVEQVNGRKLLRFSAGMINVGDGDLTVTGKAGKKKSRLKAVQKIKKQGTSRRINRPVGEFVYNRDKRKWDVLTLAEYRLLDASGSQVMATTKISFCTVDVMLARPQMQGVNFNGKYRSCPAGRKQKKITVGLSIGWADIYSENRDGQAIDVTTLPSGNYTLEIEINPGGILLESDMDNNTLRLPVTI